MKLPQLDYKKTASRFICLVLALVLAQTFFAPKIVLGELSQDTIDAINRDAVWHVFNADGPDSASCGLAATTAANGSIDRFLQVLAFQESRGNPKAQSGSSTASGKYQYINGTWKSSAKTYYPPAQQYARASDAPEEVQDAVAYLEYTKKFRDLNSDLAKLAISHYLPAAINNPALQNRVPAGGNKLTPREYADKLIANVTNGTGKEIPMRYTQAPDFPTWLAKVGGDPNLAATSPTTAACQAGVPADKFVFYSQYDVKWSGNAYGSSTIAKSGCGPSSVAMIVATLKDKNITPVETTAYGNTINAYIPGAGSSHQKMLVDTPAHYGLKSVPLGRDLNKAIEILKAGGLVLASGTGANPFTTGGHIIVLRGVTPEGKLQVGDPAHPAANTTDFDPAVIMAGVTNPDGSGTLYGVTL